MILDKLENAINYFKIHPKFEDAFRFLCKSDLAELEAKTYELDGKDLFAIVSNKPGKKREEAKLEAHRKYIDIQYLVSGNEQIGWKAYNDCKNVEQEFNPEKDIEFFSDSPQTYLDLTSQTFAIFFPEDGHAPMISDGDVHKVVIKVKLEGK